MLHVARCTFSVVRCMLHVARSLLHVACCTFFVVRCMLHVVRCMLHVVRCMLHVARFTPAERRSHVCLVLVLESRLRIAALYSDKAAAEYKRTGASAAGHAAPTSTCDNDLQHETAACNADGSAQHAADVPTNGKRALRCTRRCSAA